jgi:phosphoglycerate kinase
MKIRKFQNANLKGKRILLRVDFNVPMKNGKITEDTRIVQTLPTIKHLLKQNARLIICSHLGRPEGKVRPDMSMKAAAAHMGKLLKRQVKMMKDCIGPSVQKAAGELKPGQILFLENLRFHIEEEKNDPDFAKQLAGLAEVFVSDSFATAHRAHASTAGVCKYLPSYAGFLMQNEIENLSSLVQKPAKPLTLIVGGAKIDTKIGIIENFLGKADNFLVGGGLANTFLAAQGFNVGKSLCEADKLEVAQDTLMAAEQLHVRFVLPEDVIVADEIKEDAQTVNIPVDDVIGDMKILDIGAKTIGKFADIIKQSKTVIWNGPLGLSEMKPFSRGTAVIAQTLVWSKGVKSILGGGDTIEAVKRLGFKEEHFTFVSTGGGAMLEFLEGKILPGVAVLLGEDKAAKKAKKAPAKAKPKKPKKKIDKKPSKKNKKASQKKVKKLPARRTRKPKKSKKRPTQKRAKKGSKKKSSKKNRR